jgi:hypothetical protein
MPIQPEAILDLELFKIIWEHKRRVRHQENNLNQLYYINLTN